MYCSEYEIQSRRKTCKDCPFYRGHFKLFGITLFKRVPQCKICKCSILLKTMFLTSKCPIQKW